MSVQPLAPKPADEDAAPLFDSTRDYVENRYKEHQHKSDRAPSAIE
jgi:hypothetical protein